MSTFNPKDYLMKLQGKDYLQVKDRLLWFRLEHPEGTIVTEQLAYSNNIAAFRATVSYPIRSDDGEIIHIASATSHGSESPSDFRDYYEKAETKALGRALAALGYGTQFADDFEMLNADGTPHVVDSPVSPRAMVSAARVPKGKAPEVPAPNDGNGGYQCEECGKVIKDGKNRQGEPVTAAQRAEMSQRAYGAVLCYTHGQEAKKARSVN